MKTLSNFSDLKGKRVLVRVDFNVPIKDGKVADDSRLTASLPTIRYLMEHGAKVIVTTHLGRPKGRVVEELRLDPVAERLSQMLGIPIKKMNDCIGMDVTEAIRAMEDGGVLLLENVRFHAEEEKNDSTFAKELAALGDLFVLDGFAVAHRDAASVSGVAALLPSYAGMLLEKELIGLGRVLDNPEHPFVVIIGGAKIETKLPVVQNVMGKADSILLGGAIINNIFKARGYSVGVSLVDEDVHLSVLGKLDDAAVVLPLDVVVGTADGAHHRVADVSAVPEDLCAADEGIYDIGPKTIAMYKEYIAGAKTLVMNGAMGYFEQSPYDKGTMELSIAVADRAVSDESFVVIGGGETLQAMEMVRGTEKIDLVSTGGGAMLEYLSGEQLPGISALG